MFNEMKIYKVYTKCDKNITPKEIEQYHQRNVISSFQARKHKVPISSAVASVVARRSITFIHYWSVRISRKLQHGVFIYPRWTLR